MFLSNFIEIFLLVEKLWSYFQKKTKHVFSANNTERISNKKLIIRPGYKQFSIVYLEKTIKLRFFLCIQQL